VTFEKTDDISDANSALHSGDKVPKTLNPSAYIHKMYSSESLSTNECPNASAAG